jgi:hypothetical protein
VFKIGECRCGGTPMMLLPPVVRSGLGNVARDFNPLLLCAVKFAVSDLLPSMVIVSGFVVLMTAQLQPEKTEPRSGTAVIVTARPDG